jgi:hypothetical protein
MRAPAILPHTLASGNEAGLPLEQEDVCIRCWQEAMTEVHMSALTRVRADARCRRSAEPRERWRSACHRVEITNSVLRRGCISEAEC